jgi:O-methyltransferase
MMDGIRDHLVNWSTNPRKWKLSYIASRLKSLADARKHERRVLNGRKELLTPPIETEYVNLLHDTEFRRSLEQVKDFTCLDVARLANLWMLVRMAGPGTFVEVGSYRGGTALHICNAMGSRTNPFYCFDPFEKGGFENLGKLDSAFSPSDFTKTDYEKVVRLLSSKPNATAIQGFFPAAAEHLDLREIAFCHLDVDIYESTKKCLEYLAPRMAARSLIVLDDVDHGETPGVKKAMNEFIAEHARFLAIPMFPCQAVLLPKSFWES